LIGGKAGHKPGSVPKQRQAIARGNHLSGTVVTNGLERRTFSGTG